MLIAAPAAIIAWLFQPRSITVQASQAGENLVMCLRRLALKLQPTALLRRKSPLVLCCDRLSIDRTGQGQIGYSDVAYLAILWGLSHICPIRLDIGGVRIALPANRTAPNSIAECQGLQLSIRTRKLFDVEMHSDNLRTRLHVPRGRDEAQSIDADLSLSPYHFRITNKKIHWTANARLLLTNTRTGVAPVECVVNNIVADDRNISVESTTMGMPASYPCAEQVLLVCACHRAELPGNTDVCWQYCTASWRAWEICRCGLCRI